MTDSPTRRCTRRDFEHVIGKQLNGQSDQVRTVFKEFVNMITDKDSAREALAAMKDPLKKPNPLVQLKVLSLLGALVKNCSHDFHTQLATKKWMDRLLKIVRTSRDKRVKEKILQLLVDWAAAFQLQHQLTEFNIAIHRLRHKGIELPAPSEKVETRRRPVRRSADTVTRSRQAQQPQQTLTAIDLLFTNIQADLSNLELGIQRPEMLVPGIADECRKHLHKIEIILGTDLPEQIAHDFIAQSDQLHEYLGIYDALFTDSAPEERRAEQEANELGKLEDEIEREKESTDRLRSEIESIQHQLSQARGELAAAKAAQAKLSPLNANQQRLKETITKVISKACGVRDVARDVKSKLQDHRAQLRPIIAKFPSDLKAALYDFPDHVEKSKTGETKAMQTLKRLYASECATRKKLYNKLQELRGNIRVYCRVRPLSEKEETQYGSEPCVTFPNDGEIVVKEGGKTKVYEFDVVFSPDKKQADVFEDTKPLINCVIDGYKVCIFAYGQTGSGKTYTMAGPKENPGVNKRAVSRLFELVAERKEMEDITVSLSVLEIYNESIRDLLNAKDTGEKDMKYEIKTHPVDGQYVTNLSSHAVTTLEEIEKWVSLAEKNRSSQKTQMNERSSRSHMLLYIVCRSKNLQSQVTTVGKLALVDLAGSERVAKSGVQGKEFEEARNINKSLSALGDVIAALSSNQSHVPYRNSRLTHLLQDSLGGNSKCLMFVNISPSPYNANESNNSLAFASRARGVVLGPAKKNVLDS